jgi:AcrR family transcriptional regulator
MLVGMSVDRPAAAVRSGGRPRHDEDDRGRVITEAVLEAVFEQGLPGVTMEGIARRAGVAKTTIYRRWPNREAMIIEALSTISAAFEPPDTGDLRGDLKQMVGASVGSGLVGLAGRGGMARLIIAAASDQRYWRIAMDPWSRLVRQVLERGRERGEVRRDLNVELVVDLLTGAFVFPVLGQTRQMNEAYLEEVMDVILEGIARSDCPPHLRAPRRGVHE